MNVEKEIFIPKRIPSENDFMGRHWRSYYKRHRESWERDLGYVLGRGQHNDKRRTVRITAYQKNSRSFYDRGNLIGGAKPVLDSLKSLGWIKDDSSDWIYDIYDQKVVGEDGTTEVGTRIEIFEQGQDVIFDDQAVPSFFVCSSCLGDILGLIRERRIPPKMMVSPGMGCVKCGGEARFSLKFWELEYGREEAPEKATKVKASDRGGPRADKKGKGGARKKAKGGDKKKASDSGKGE